MKKIQILGTGCPKCKQLAANVQQAIDELGGEYELQKITDITEIMKFGVMMLPALAVNGQIEIVGKVPSAKEIEDIIK